MNAGITVYPRKYTFTRVSTGPMPDPDKSHTLYRPQWCDVKESFVAYMIFVSVANDGYSVQFYDLTPNGDPYITRIVTRVTEIDNGTIVK